MRGKRWDTQSHAQDWVMEQGFPFQVPSRLDCSLAIKKPEWVSLLLALKITLEYSPLTI